MTRIQIKKNLKTRPKTERPKTDNLKKKEKNKTGSSIQENKSMPYSERKIKEK